MKQYKHPAVPMHLKKNIIPMNKVFTWAVMLFATAFLSFQTTDILAQCENSTRGRYSPIIWVDKGEIQLFGFTETANMTLPLSYHLYNAESNESIASGIIDNIPASLTPEETLVQITDLSIGKYILTFCDASATAKSVSREVFLSQSK